MSEEAPYTELGCSVLILEGIADNYGQKEVQPTQQLSMAFIAKVKVWKYGRSDWIYTAYKYKGVPRQPSMAVKINKEQPKGVQCQLSNAVQIIAYLPDTSHLTDWRRSRPVSNLPRDITWQLRNHDLIVELGKICFSGLSLSSIMSLASSDFDFWDFVACAKCQLPFSSNSGGTVPFWLTECGHVICNTHLSEPSFDWRVA